MRRRFVIAIVITASCLLAGACATYEHPGPPANSEDSDKVFVCHESTRTLRVSDEEARQHLNHGDRLGRC